MTADLRYARPVRRRLQRDVAWWLTALLLVPAHLLAQRGPQPPCGTAPSPIYPALDDAAVVTSWTASEIGRDWRPPACTGWTAAGFTTLVTTVARFRLTSDAEGLRRHIGAISHLTGMRYWSTTHHRWQTLVEDAYALTGAPSGARRQDFTSEEMQDGTTRYFAQVDNLSGKGTYRLRVAEASADRLVVEIENVSTMRYFFVPVFPPGEMQSIYFLDRESGSVWRYYGLLRTGVGTNHLLGGNAASAVNRAVAFYRYVVGIPTDQEPPAAR